MRAILLRAAIYPLGFISIVLLAKCLRSENFAIYVILQAASELCILFSVAGTGLVLTRRTSKSGLVETTASHIKVCAAGLPMSLVILSLANWIFVEFSWQLVVSQLGAVFFHSVSNLRSISLRGKNDSGIQSVEFIARSGLLILLAAGCLARNISLSVNELFVAQLGINALICIGVEFRTAARYSFEANNVPLKEVLNLWATLSASFSFLNKKSDPLLLGYFYNPLLAGAFKIAFPAIEAPLQLYAAWLAGRTSKFSTDDWHTTKRHLRLLCLRGFWIGLILCTLASVPILILERLSVVPERSYELSLTLIPLMIIRCSVLPIEYIATLRASLWRILILLIAAGLFRLVVYAVLSTYLQASLTAVFISLAALEAAVGIAYYVEIGRVG